jgi:hypothetical protein
LGLTHAASCCEELAGASAPVVAEPPRTDLPTEALQFEQPCAVCHRTAEPFPPNFLAGDAKRVSEALAHCAPRIFVRLSMWLQDEATRDKVPMPPPAASRAGEPWRQAHPIPAVESLAAAAAQWLRKETGHAPNVGETLANGYENLRPCLPAGA